MSSSNRVQLAVIREVTPGVTPASPRLRTMRITGESLSFTPEFVDSEELRSDRNMGDPIKIIQSSSGGVNFEFSYPDMFSPLDEIFRSAFFSSWVTNPALFNDGIADSVITSTGGASGFEYALVNPGLVGVIVGSLIQATGFANAGNNRVFTTIGYNSGVVVGFGGPALVPEPLPPGTARLKIVGWQNTFAPATGGVSPHDHVVFATVVNGGTGGTNGPVTITGTTGTSPYGAAGLFQAKGTISGGVLQPGLTMWQYGNYAQNPTNPAAEPVTGGNLVGATVALTFHGSVVAWPPSGSTNGYIDIWSTQSAFTDIGLRPGMWIKLGGTDTTSRFSNPANNDFVRITSISAYLYSSTSSSFSRVYLDNLPAGWTGDAGQGKQIKIWFGDQIKNGVTPNPMTLEKGFLDQAAPTYIVNRGMQVNTLGLTIINREKIRGVVDMMGMNGSQSTTTLDPLVDPATTGAIMAAHANVGRLSEAGSKLTDPNWASEMSFQINNNLRRMEAVDEGSPVGINAGECTVTGRLVTYFGSNAILQKLYAGTATSLATRVSKNNQAVVFTFPRVTLRNGVPAAAGKNQDVSLASDWSAGFDPVYGCAIMCDRFEYFES